MDPQALISKGISFDPKDWKLKVIREFQINQLLFFESLFYYFICYYCGISVLTAYPLSKKDLVGKKWIMLLVFTCFVVVWYRHISW